MDTQNQENKTSEEQIQFDIEFVQKMINEEKAAFKEYREERLAFEEQQTQMLLEKDQMRETSSNR
jgi:hypothetical protein